MTSLSYHVNPCAFNSMLNKSTLQCICAMIEFHIRGKNGSDFTWNQFFWYLASRIFNKGAGMWHSLLAWKQKFMECRIPPLHKNILGIYIHLHRERNPWHEGKLLWFSCMSLFLYLVPCILFFAKKKKNFPR